MSEQSTPPSDIDENLKTSTYDAIEEIVTPVKVIRRSVVVNNTSSKKSNIASHYRLRKRRSAFLQSDTSSDEEEEDGDNDLNNVDNESVIIVEQHEETINQDSNSINKDTINSDNPYMTNYSASANGSANGNANGNTMDVSSSLQTESNVNEEPPRNNSIETTSTITATSSVNNQDANDCDTINELAMDDDASTTTSTVSIAPEDSPIFGNELSDFVDNHSERDILKHAKYASILRLFALQYNTFPARVIDNRFMAMTFEHNDNVKPDYKLISPFIYYYADFTSFELSYYYQMLLLFLHSRICRLPQICMNRLCVGYQAIVLHLKQCFLFKCKNIYCFSARLVIHHVITCTKDQCKFCSTLPSNVVDYCKSCLYSNDQNCIKLVAILKSCFSVPCISHKNEEYSAPQARKILNNILNDYISIDKNVFSETVNKFLASIDRKKIINDMVQSINKAKIDVINKNDPILSDCTNFENTLYRYSHNKDIYLQSVSNISQMLQFFSQVMIKTQMDPMEELNKIVSRNSIIGVSVRSMMMYQTAPTNSAREALLDGGCANPADRNLSYGYENMVTFTPTSIFPPKKIGDLFLPLIQDMYNSSDGLAFQVPVDPVYFMIYDYYDIIEYPMDLHTIITRLKERFYIDPWEVIHDIWQTLKNAWIYNRRTTRVYKIATRLKDMFLENVEPIIKSLKLCCAYRRVLTPQPLFCMGKDYCVIHREAVYYIHQNYYIYCEKCFNDISGDKVSIVMDAEEEDNNTTISTADRTNDSIKAEDHTANSSTTISSSHESHHKSNTTTTPSAASGVRLINKSEFVKETNSKVFMESFVECKQCHRQAHQTCKLHTTEIDGIHYYCDDCLEKFPKFPRITHYSSEHLMETHMSTFIEKNVNDMLLNKLGKQSQPVRIRMVYNNMKKLKTSPIINEYFVDKYPSEFMYHSKALFAFQKLNDGTEVCFFGMHVQEFDDTVPEPNKGRAYLSYLDSVHFFQPKYLKTQVYFTILTAYFEYVRRRGFSYVHLWACPPCEGDDYIFHCHPVEQRVPKHKRLVDWYRKLLDECVKSRIFTKIKDLHKYLTSEKKSELTMIPYFEGDYWPNAFEDVINEVKAEKNPADAATSNIKTSSLSRGRAMLMQNYDKEDPEDDSNNNNNNTQNDNSANNQNNNNSTINDDEEETINDSSEVNSINSTTKNKQSTTKFTKKKRPSKFGKFSRQKKSKVSQKKRNEPAQPEFLTVEQRLFNLLERFKDVFFVCKLNNYNNSSTLSTCSINTLTNDTSVCNNVIQKEVDPPIHCDLTDGRSGFLQLCRERKWEFSTLLRTKFTTLGFLVELHIQFGDRFIFTCNNCKCHLFNKYHCTICADFDLCYKCYYMFGHEHQMVEVSDANNGSADLVDFNRTNMQAQPLQHNVQNMQSNLQSIQQTVQNIQSMKPMQPMQYDYKGRGNTNNRCNTNRNYNNNNISSNNAGANNQPPSVSIIQPSSQQSNIIVAQELLDIMLHCSSCSIENIHQPCSINVKCQRMRIAIKHCNECNAPDRLKCAICHSLMTLCVPHARACRARSCKVVFCNILRGRVCFNPTDASNSNDNRHSYQPRKPRSPSFDSQRRMAQIHQPNSNYMQTDTTRSTIPDVKDLSNNSAGKMKSSSMVGGGSNQSYATQKHISPSKASTANRNNFAGQKDSSYYHQASQVSAQQSSMNKNNNMMLISNQFMNVQMSTPKIAPSDNLTLMNSPTKASTATTSTNKSLITKQPKVSLMANLSLNDRPSDGEVSFYNPLKNKFFSRTTIYGNELSMSDSSFDAIQTPPSGAVTNSPVGIKVNPEYIKYMKEIPGMIDPNSNPSIPVRDILASNLNKLRQSLDVYGESCENDFSNILKYVKMFPFVMCHLSDIQQNLVISFIKGKQSKIELDEKEETLILFLHRIQAARIIQKIQLQHSFYKGNVDSIMQSVQQQSDHALKSLWSMPKQKIIDFVNSFRVMNEFSQVNQTLTENGNNNNVSSNVAFNTTKTEEILTPSISLIQNTQKIADKFSKNDGVANQKNVSNVCYVAPNSYNNIANDRLEYYLKTLLSTNHKSFPNGGGVNKSGNSQMNISTDGGQRENIPLSISADNVEHAKTSHFSPHSVKETNLPNLAIFSCDNQKKDSFVGGGLSSSSDQLPFS